MRREICSERRPTGEAGAGMFLRFRTGRALLRIWRRLTGPMERNRRRELRWTPAGMYLERPTAADNTTMARCTRSSKEAERRRWWEHLTETMGRTRMEIC